MEAGGVAADGADASGPMGAVDASARDAEPSADAATSFPDANATDASIDSPSGDAAIYLDDAGLPSSAACLTGGNVLWVDGDPDSWWFVGQETITSSGGWGSQADNYYATYDGVIVEAALTANPTPDRWYFQLNTWGTGKPMVAGTTYSNAPNPPAGTAAIPSDDFVIGYGWTCGMVVGTFRIEEFTAAPGDSGANSNQLLSFTAVFSAVCDRVNPTHLGVLRGCIHYAAGSDAGG
jgi:hypothetical protein